MPAQTSRTSSPFNEIAFQVFGWCRLQVVLLNSSRKWGSGFTVSPGEGQRRSFQKPTLEAVLTFTRLLLSRGSYTD